MSQALSRARLYRVAPKKRKRRKGKPKPPPPSRIIRLCEASDPARDRWFAETNRKLRRQQTPWELMLGGILASHRIPFVCQQRIGPYFADFLLPRYRLVIELDGEWHCSPEQRKRDLIRQKEIERRGLRVLRFWNREITLEQEKEVAAKVKAAFVVA